MVTFRQGFEVKTAHVWQLKGTLAISAMLYFFNKTKLPKANWKKNNIIKFDEIIGLCNSIHFSSL